MRAKKAGGIVYGSELTSEERTAMNLEIQRQLAEYDRNHMLEIEAMILWQLHEQFGFGTKRLKRFSLAFSKAVKDLERRYELEDPDQLWLCTKMLKDIGFDIETLNNVGGTED